MSDNALSKRYLVLVHVHVFGKVKTNLDTHPFSRI